MTQTFTHIEANGLNAAAINHLFDEENKNYLQQSLPAITNWSKVIQLIK